MLIQNANAINLGNVNINYRIYEWTLGWGRKNKRKAKIANVFILKLLKSQYQYLMNKKNKGSNIVFKCKSQSTIGKNNSDINVFGGRGIEVM